MVDEVAWSQTRSSMETDSVLAVFSGPRSLHPLVDISSLYRVCLAAQRLLPDYWQVKSLPGPIIRIRSDVVMSA